MADGITIPVTGSGDATPKVYTDDLGASGHVQFMKLMDGTLDSSTKLMIKAEDAASADGDTGIIAMVVRKDTPANTSGTDGDFEMLQVSGGKLWVHPIGDFTTISVDVARPANTTTYTIGDALADTTPTVGGFTFTSAGRISGGSGLMTDLWVTFEEDAATPLQAELHIFDAAVTAIADNAAYAVSDAEAKTQIGTIPFGLIDNGNQDVAHVQNLAIGFSTSGSANLRFLIKVKNGYVPTTNSSIITFKIKILQVN